ncbi:MAG: hypothetical protein ABIC19_00430 [Patescibacteria group bacterium]
MNENQEKSSIFKIPEACPVCLSGYYGTRGSLVKSRGRSMIIHITCPKCETSVISNVSLGGIGMMAVGMLSDLGKEDLFLIKDQQALTVDDVLEIHEIMEKKQCLSFNK